MEEQLRIAILATPGMGRLIPIVELAKRLALHHHFRVICIIPVIRSPSKAMKGVIEGLPTGIDHVFLPPVLSMEELEGAQPGIQVSLTMTRSLPFVRDVLKSLVETTPLAAFVLDHSASDALDIAKEFNVPPYIFFPSNALALSLLLHLPKLDETIPCEYRDLPEPLQLPGCIPIHGKDLMDPIQDRKGEWYKSFLRLTKRLRLADGIMINTFMDLEGRAIKALEVDEAGNPPLYPIGPIIQTGSSTNQLVDGSECLSWLDNQPSGSVLFVSFGSGGTLSYDQLNELALGLELSEQKFLWVVRRPDNERANAALLSDQSREDPLVFLPKGFVERTRGQGLVVPSWAPQAHVLSHGSTENECRILVEDLKVALRPKADEKGLVDREEIKNVIKGLFLGDEGKIAHSQMKDLKSAAERAISAGGSSTRALSELASKLASKTRPL
ncbi:Hydroquinone glucosyltransferase [Morella rubra]|uniref:Hydroquinone glucosyltransferase n=1 Tax=Morella rubra TaxID=262757 RepID=A0A6A1WJ03_9ROSI|nr:Hydroquinone glucosyltransferase [Morella rubra]